MLKNKKNIIQSVLLQYIVLGSFQDFYGIKKTASAFSIFPLQRYYTYYNQDISLVFDHLERIISLTFSLTGLVLQLVNNF